MEPSSFVIEANLDAQTLEELKTLREIRLGLVKKQLAEAEETIEELVRRELIPADEKLEYLDELKEELAAKITLLSGRAGKSSNMIHFDELELYVDLLSDHEQTV
jgi:uncharacterized protein YpbB